MKKLIGIIAEEETPSSSAFDALRFLTNKNYSDAIGEQGAIPILLLRTETTLDIIPLLDGLLLQGGLDVDPSLYNEEKTELCGASSLDEDIFQMKVLRAADDRKIRILGICRGLQLTNVAFGGSLYQDISYFTKFNHNLKEDSKALVHEIDIKEKTKLHSLIGKSNIYVNSLHHQAIKTLAPGFKASAYSKDGCIEAIERDNIIAVQWHPEALKEKNDKMKTLFSWLCD